MEYNNRGILFRNLRKSQPKHPDVVGEATIDSRKFKIAGWIKPGKRGEFHSLAFTEEQPQAESSPKPTQAAEPASVPQPLPDDDIPF